MRGILSEQPELAGTPLPSEGGLLGEVSHSAHSHKGDDGCIRISAQKKGREAVSMWTADPAREASLGTCPGKGHGKEEQEPPGSRK